MKILPALRHPSPRASRHVPEVCMSDGCTVSFSNRFPFLCLPCVYSVIVTGEEETAVKEGNRPVNWGKRVGTGCALKSSRSWGGGMQETTGNDDWTVCQCLTCSKWRESGPDVTLGGVEDRLCEKELIQTGRQIIPKILVFNFGMWSGRPTALSQGFFIRNWSPRSPWLRLDNHCDTELMPGLLVLLSSLPVAEAFPLRACCSPSFWRQNDSLDSSST